MAETSDAAALPPISADDPCGPDLDLAGDPEYMNFMAAAEGLLPTGSYFAFDRKTVDLPAALEAAERLLRALARPAPHRAPGQARRSRARSGRLRALDRGDRLAPRTSLGRGPSARLRGRLRGAPDAALDARRRAGHRPAAAIRPARRNAARRRAVFRAHLVAPGEVKPRVENRVNGRPSRARARTSPPRVRSTISCRPSTWKSSPTRSGRCKGSAPRWRRSRP